jgi:hypothetical protein
MRRLLPALILAPLGLLLAEPPRNQFHREGFAGRQPVFMLADANVTIEEKDHRIVSDRYYNAPASEYLKFEAKPAGKAVDTEFAHYVCDVPKTPVKPADGSSATASIWVRSFRSGVQLRARVRFPKERDPAQPEQELSCLILGETYPEEKVRSWQRLSLGNPAEALTKQLPLLRATLKREIDTSGAYIDRVILNVSSGPGTCELWIDDLDIGPCTPDDAKPKLVGTATTRAKEQFHPFSVEFKNGGIRIDDKPFFMRAVRWTDRPLKDLRDENFNTIVLPAESEPHVIEEAIRNGYMIVAGVPLASPPNVGEPINALGADVEKLAEHFRRFRGGDGVLIWDLGMNRKTEDVRAVIRTAETLRSYDPRRPRSVNLWDGFSAYSESMNVIGSHRWPLFTDLPLDRHREWLLQRRALSAPGKLHWTWIQAHAPDWYVRMAEPNAAAIQLASTLPGKTAAIDPTLPIGPQPEQIRLLTYLAIACGYRGYGVWNDRWLAKSHFGTDRATEMYLLNCEMQLLEPVLFAAEEEKTTWEPTSHPHVKAAIIRGRKGIIVLPVWLGPGSQCVPAQAAVDNLVIKVRLVPEGYDPWVLTPASYENLHASGRVRQVPGGTEITIPKFDLTSMVVFTNDTAPDGLIVRWQDNIRHTFGKDAARKAREQARDVFDKVSEVHGKLTALGAPPVQGADDLFEQAKRAIRLSAKAFDNGQNDIAYREARAALRPLRVIMHDHWRHAVTAMPSATASPFAVGFYTLPQHYELANRMRTSAPGSNLIEFGGFELTESATGDGAAIASLPGWTARQTSLDGASLLASIITITDPIRGKTEGLGNNCLRLMVTPKPNTNPKQKDAAPPQALERTSVAVSSPMMAAKPGSWVRLSFRVKVPKPIDASADGAVIFDTAGGEPLAVRCVHQPEWKRFALYRQVPAEGQIGITFALTGLGTAYFDDVRIEAMTE